MRVPIVTACVYNNRQETSGNSDSISAEKVAVEAENVDRGDVVCHRRGRLHRLPVLFVRRGNVLGPRLGVVQLGNRWVDGGREEVWGVSDSSAKQNKIYVGRGRGRCGSTLVQSRGS